MADFRVCATVKTHPEPDKYARNPADGRTIQVPSFVIENTTRQDAEKMAMEIVNPTGDDYTVSLSIEQV